jgi:hypothetical protein
MFDRPMPIALLALLVASTIGLAACGSGGEKQDAIEAEGDYAVRVLDASFPGRQRLADEVDLRITVKNEDTKAIPNLAVTVDGFSRRDEDVNLSDPNRPIWVVERGPNGSPTAHTNTWTVGEVPAGQTRVLTWKVSAVRPGTYSLRWRVAAGLDGKAKALEDGQAPSGSFIARVSEKPHPVQID